MTEHGLCGICENGPKDVHDRAEEEGLIHHQWSPTGQLIPSDPKAIRERVAVRQEGNKGGTVQRVISVPDVVLRSLLIEKGIITFDELQLKEAEFRDRLRVPASPPIGG